MKNLKCLAIALIQLLIFSSMSFADIKATKTVGITINVQPGEYGLWVYGDSTSDTQVSEMNNEGYLGPIFAGGERKLRVGTNYLKIKVGGTWELVTYTDYIGTIGLPVANEATGQKAWADMTPTQKVAWVEAHSGLGAVSNPDVRMPVKVRSEGIQGGEDLDNEGNIIQIGDEITTEEWQDDAAEFSYIPEKVNETELGALPVKVAKIVLTDLTTMGRIQLRYGINEAFAGNETYTGTIYYELRGN